jgi:hypothetical protein
MKKARAKEIATKLSDPERWHTHGYGISMEVLTKDLKLLIDDFGAKPELSEKIKRYYSLLVDYMAKLGQQGVFHAVGHYHPIQTRG